MGNMIQLWEEGTSYITSIRTTLIPPKGSLLHINDRCWRVTGHPEFIVLLDMIVVKITVEVKPTT